MTKDQRKKFRSRQQFAAYSYSVAPLFGNKCNPEALDLLTKANRDLEFRKQIVIHWNDTHDQILNVTLKNEMR